MYKIFFILTIFCVSLFSSISFEKDYKTALEKSKESKKPIFVMVSSPQCPECNYMKKNIFIQKDVYEYINKNYISIDFDVKDKSIPKQMKYWGIPRFYFTNDGVNVYKKKMGGMKKEPFVNFITKDN